MFQSSKTVTVSKLWWEMDRGPYFKRKDEKYNYEEEIWPVVEFLESEGFIELSSA